MAQSRNSFPNEMLPCTTLATQKYKGVRMRPEWGAWVTDTQDPNTKKRIWLGSYHTAEMAARAYDAAVVCLKGPNYPKLNFPYALFNPDQDWPCTDHEVIKAIARAAAHAPISSSIPAAHNATQNFLPMAEAQSSAETRRSSRSPSAVSKLWECWIDNLEFDNSTADSSHMVQDAQDPYMPAELERSLRSGHPIEEFFCSDELRVFNRIHHVHPERDD